MQTKDKLITGIVAVIAVIVTYLIFAASSAGLREARPATTSWEQKQEVSTGQPRAVAPVTPEVGMLPPQNEFLVRYTDDGFSPAEITVTPGKAVTFKNESSGGMRVASNPHPTHGFYQGFDQGQIVPRGGSYTFNFERVGVWGYHNHLKPAAGGTVIVRSQ